MQKTINIALGVAVLALGAGLAASLLDRPAAPDDVAIRAMIDEAVTERLAAVPATDTADIGADIESYLMENPALLERMSMALDEQRRGEEIATARAALATYEDQIYNDPANIVLGNPEGEITIVEMFDYNCGYCRQVVPDVMALIAENPDLRVILKEFPILSQGSVDAARIGVLVNQSDADYAEFHTALFSARGSIDGEAALAAAQELGLNRIELELDMNGAEITGAIQRTYDIAQALGVSGTPTFIIGDEVIPGALPKADLERRIVNMRECGQTVCS
jgi:protein-disulfide isomerase